MININKSRMFLRSFLSLVFLASLTAQIKAVSINDFFPQQLVDAVGLRVQQELKTAKLPLNLKTTTLERKLQQKYFIEHLKTRSNKAGGNLLSLSVSPDSTKITMWIDKAQDSIKKAEKSLGDLSKESSYTSDVFTDVDNNIKKAAMYMSQAADIFNQAFGTSTKYGKLAF